MKVVKISRDEWAAYLEQCESATFFHTPIWYSVWDTYSNAKSSALLFEFPSGNTALLPLSERTIHKGLTKVYDSSPAGTYGGFISPNSLTREEVGLLMAYAKKKTINITFNPYQPLEGLDGLEQDFTQRIDLREGVDKSQWDDYSYYKKKGEKNRLEISKGLVKEDWLGYFGLYEKSLKRWGANASSRYDYEMFELLRLIDSKKCQLWLVLVDGKLIYGAVYFLYKNIMTQWHAAGDGDYYKYHPAFFLHDQVIDFALENSLNFYDFNPSGGHQGVEKFKNHFRPEKVYFPIFSTQNSWYLALDSLSKIIKIN